MSEYVISVDNLKKYFYKKNSITKAVDDVSFQIKEGTTMALVGESGCGKSTLAKSITRLGDGIDDGTVKFKGIDIYSLSEKEMRKLRPQIQYIFQDPYASLSPNMTVFQIIAEGVIEHKIVSKNEVTEYVADIMNECGLDWSMKDRYPKEFSGGQRQRICIARVIAMKPDFIVCDEPVSALDVSIQAQIINLLIKLQEDLNLTYLFISHDLSVVKVIAHKTGVMYNGKIVEYGDTNDILNNPEHEYTKELIAAIPKIVIQ